MEKNYFGFVFFLSFSFINTYIDLIDHMILILINEDTLSSTSKQILLEINNKKSSFMLEKFIDILTKYDKIQTLK